MVSLWSKSICVTCKLLMSVYFDMKSLYPHLKVNWNMLMCKICIARRWLSTFSRDAMRILCLSLAGRWWRAERETGQLFTPIQNLKSLVKTWTLNACTSGLIQKRNHPKFLTLHSPFCLLIRKNTQTEWSSWVFWNLLLLMKPSDAIQNGLF